MQVFVITQTTKKKLKSTRTTIKFTFALFLGHLHMSRKPAKPQKLDDFIIKTLLQAVEECDKPREEVKLRQLCNKDLKVFGEPGSERRRRVQFIFNYIKKLSIDKYMEKLDSLEVTPSAATNRLFRAFTDKQSHANISDLASSFAQLDVSKEDDNDDDDDDDDDFDDMQRSPFDDPFATNPVKPSNLVQPSPAKKPPVQPSPVKMAPPPMSTPPPSYLKSPPVPFTMVPYRTTGDSPYRTTGAEVSFAKSPFRTTGDEDIIHGSATNPTIIYVDPKRPWNNGPFEVSRVSNVVHADYNYNVWHIRTEVSVEDGIKGVWEAKVLKDGVDDDLKDRAILVKGFMRSYWMRQADLYNGKIGCEVTKRVIKATEITLSNIADSKYYYWLLVFPEGTRLGQYIFSGTKTFIDRDIVGLSIPAAQSKTGVESKAYISHWRIAETDGATQIADQDAEKDLTKLFG